MILEASFNGVGFYTTDVPYDHNNFLHSEVNYDSEKQIINNVYQLNEEAYNRLEQKQYDSSDLQLEDKFFNDQGWFNRDLISSFYNFFYDDSSDGNVVN